MNRKTSPFPSARVPHQLEAAPTRTAGSSDDTAPPLPLRRHPSDDRSPSSPPPSVPAPAALAQRRRARAPACLPHRSHRSPRLRLPPGPARLPVYIGIPEQPSF